MKAKRRRLPVHRQAESKSIPPDAVQEGDGGVEVPDCPDPPEGDTPDRGDVFFNPEADPDGQDSPEPPEDTGGVWVTRALYLGTAFGGALLWFVFYLSGVPASALNVIAVLAGFCCGMYFGLGQMEAGLSIGGERAETEPWESDTDMPKCGNRPERGKSAASALTREGQDASEPYGESSQPCREKS